MTDFTPGTGTPAPQFAGQAMPLGDAASLMNAQQLTAAKEVLAADDVPPSLLVQVVCALARHGLTYLAGLLGTARIFTSDERGQFVTLGLSMTLAVLSFAWSVIQKRNATRKAG